MNRREFLLSLLSVPFGWRTLFRKRENFLPTGGTEEIANLPDGPMMAYELPLIAKDGCMINDGCPGKPEWPMSPPFPKIDWPFPVPVYLKWEDGVTKYCPDISAQEPKWYRWTANTPLSDQTMLRWNTAAWELII